MPFAQAVSDRMFRIRHEDNGNRRRVSHVLMTFGQFMDHDFARVIHGPTDACLEKQMLFFCVLFYQNIARASGF